MSIKNFTVFDELHLFRMPKNLSVLLMELMGSHRLILTVATLEQVFACFNTPFVYNSRQSGMWDHLTNKYNIHSARHLGNSESEAFLKLSKFQSKIWTDKAAHGVGSSRGTAVPSMGRDVMTRGVAAPIIECRKRTSPCHASHCDTRTACVM